MIYKYYIPSREKIKYESDILMINPICDRVGGMF